MNDNKLEARKLYLEERQKEDNREARHILADQLGVDMISNEQEKIHERRLLGLWFKPVVIPGHLDNVSNWCFKLAL